MMFELIVLVFSVFGSVESVIPNDVGIPNFVDVFPSEASEASEVPATEDPAMAAIKARMVELEISRKQDRMYDAQMNRKVAKLQERVATLEQGARVSNTVINKQGRETHRLATLLKMTQSTLDKKNAQLAADLKILSFKDTRNLLTLSQDIKLMAEKDTKDKIARQPWYMRKLGNDIKTLQLNQTQLAAKVNTLVAIDRKLATAMKILVADNSQIATEVQTLNANITAPVSIEELEELEVKMLNMTANSTQNMIVELESKMESLMLNSSALEANMMENMTALEKNIEEKTVVLQDEVKMLVAMSHQQIVKDVKGLVKRDSELRIEMRAMAANHSLLAQDVTKLAGNVSEEESNASKRAADLVANCTKITSDVEEMSFDIAALYEADTQIATNIKILGAKEEQTAGDITHLTAGMATLTGKGSKAMKLSKLSKVIKALRVANGEFVSKLDALQDNNIQLATIIKTKIEELGAKDVALEAGVLELGDNFSSIADEVKQLDEKQTKVGAVTKILAERSELNPTPASSKEASEKEKEGGTGANITALQTNVDILMANDAQLISRLKDLFAKDVVLENTVNTLVDENNICFATTMELVANSTKLTADVLALQNFDVELTTQVEGLAQNTTQFATDINGYLSQNEDDLKELKKKDEDLTQDIYTAWMCNDSGIKCFNYYTFKSGAVDYKLLLEQVSAKLQKGKRVKNRNKKA